MPKGCKGDETPGKTKERMKEGQYINKRENRERNWTNTNKW